MPHSLLLTGDRSFDDHYLIMLQLQLALLSPCMIIISMSTALIFEIGIGLALL